MTRLFLSFYLFMAVSLVLISTMLEWVWPKDNSELSKDVVLVQQLLPLAMNEPDRLLSALRAAKIDYVVNPANNTNWSAQEREQLEQGQTLTLFDDTAKYLYVMLKDNRVLVVTLPYIQLTTPYALVYLSVFLLLLGVLLAIWLWPLWRDLSYLTRKVSDLGQSSSDFSIALKKRSAMQPIANKLNMLSERVHRLLRDQQELTGAVAHEFRTPIARLKFALEMQPEPNSTAWNGVVADLDELEGLVQEMLDYTQFDAKTPELNIAQIPASAMCENLVTRLVPTTNKSLRVTGAEVYLRGDSHFVERAVSNLLTNAIRHAKDNIEVKVSADNNTVRIAIHDDGQGVDPKLAQRIFEPFYRPDNSRVRYSGGAGLGLAIVKRIQNWHQGEVLVSTSPLGGACFTLCYPK